MKVKNTALLILGFFIITAFTNSAAFYVDQGFKAYKAHNYKSALLLYNKALKLEPKNPQALNGKGVVLAFSGKPKEGLKYINQAIALKPKYLTAYFNAGLANELAHDYPAAIKAYKVILAADPKNTWSYYGIACAYGSMGDASHATQYLIKAIALDKNVKKDARSEKDFDRVRKDKGFLEVIK
jgi:tetratricopeptide (TPR) repeat protein